MSDTPHAAAPMPEKTSVNPIVAAHWFSNGVFLTAIILLAVEMESGKPVFGTGGYLELTLLLSSIFSTLTALWRRLPGQNVLLATALIAGISAIVQAVGVRTAIPFGSFIYRDAAGF